MFVAEWWIISHVSMPNEATLLLRVQYRSKVSWQFLETWSLKLDSRFSKIENRNLSLETQSLILKNIEDFWGVLSWDCQLTFDQYCKYCKICLENTLQTCKRCEKSSRRTCAFLSFPKYVFTNSVSKLNFILLKKVVFLMTFSNSSEKYKWQQ